MANYVSQVIINFQLSPMLLGRRWLLYYGDASGDMIFFDKDG